MSIIIVDTVCRMVAACDSDSEFELATISLAFVLRLSMMSWHLFRCDSCNFVSGLLDGYTVSPVDMVLVLSVVDEGGWDRRFDNIVKFDCWSCKISD